LNERGSDYVGLPEDHPLRLGIDTGAAWDSHIPLLHPDDHEETRRVWSTCLRTSCAGQVSFRIRSAEGGYRWFLNRAEPVRASDGTVLYWIGINLDIEEQKQAEFYLAEGQRIAHMGSWAFNAAGFNYWSSELFKIHGLDPDGKPPTVEEYLELVHPEDRGFMEHGIQKMLTDHRGFDFTKRIVRPDGEIRHVRCVGVPVRGGVTVQAFVGTGIDVTERKRAEEELQQLVDFLPHHILVLDSDGKLIHANRVVQQYTGLTLDEFRSLDVIGEVIHPDDAERMLGKDGIYRWFLFRYNPLVEDGRVRRWYASATEIESRKQEEERIRQENVRLEERTRIARELHDTLLQTFLSASMQLNVALDGISPDSLVKPRLDRILQLMNQGIEEGRSTIQGLRASDSRVMDLVIALTRVQQELPVRHDIDFHVRVAGRQQPLSPLIQQETYRIGREALLNAFCHSGAKRVECELDYADQDLQMRIRDNGTGIDPQVLHNGREGHWGLAGMRERAAKIGGSLNISSSATAGTEVRLSVPSIIAFQFSAKAKSG
jgi:PAS domain S-box-containing protein